MSQRSTSRRCQSCGTKLAWDNTGDLCASCQRSRRSELGPPRLPAEFWESPALQEALAESHIGKVFQTYRHAPHHGPRPIPQDVLAGWLGLTQTQVSRYENGAAVTDLKKLIAWARILRISRQYLWFRLPDQRSPSRVVTDAPDNAPDDSTSPPQPGMLTAREPGQAEGGDTRRKDFLAGAGAMLVSILAPPLIHDWREPSPSNIPHLDDQVLAQLRAQTEGFRWLDRQEGAAQLLPSTTKHARDLATFWRLTDDHHALRDELAIIAADACHLVAYQAFDQGQRAQAVEWYRSSADLAGRARCQDLYVFAMCGVAYMHARNQNGDLALSVLQQLQPLSLSTAARCYLAAYEAHAHAARPQLGKAKRDVVLSALDQAASFADTTQDEPPSPWLGIPGTSFVERQRALTMASFGDEETLDLLDRLEEQTSAVFQRYQVTLVINRALTYASRGDVDKATGQLVTAVEHNLHVRSVEKHNLIREARRVLEPHRDSRAVQAVDELLRDQRVRALNTGAR